MNGPDRLGRYSVIRKVGSGGFATVWLARDETLDAEVAIKVLAEHWVEDDDVRGRFLAEGRFLRRVDSPHVVGVHDIGETDEGRPFLVLTYADRGSLESRLKDGPLELGEAVEVIRQVATGLQALHNRGLLHRDIKPDNVLFRSTPDGERAMVGDLGLGKSLDAVSRLTMPGGTPAYVAPEQVRGDQLDPRADQYALASVAYAALSGRSPYGAKTLGAVLAIDAPPPPLRDVQPDVPAAVDAAVLRGLSLDREDRFEDVTAFAAALTTAHTGGAPQHTHFDRPAPKPVEPKPEPDSPKPVVSETGKVSVAESAPAKAGGRARVWLAAGIATAVLSAAGAYGGYRLGTDRQWVEAKDQSGHLSVKVPRGWATQLVGSGWRPEGAAATLPALLVSADNAGWPDPAKGVSGVFVGELQTGELPDSIDPPAGCAAANLQNKSDVDGRVAITAVFANCPVGKTTYERVVIDAGHVIRIQVRRPAEDDDAFKVLDSVRYR